MASLLDIAPLTETVSVGGKDIDVYGLPDAGIADLFARFPDLRKLVTGYRVEPERLIEMGGEAPSAIIGWGCIPPDAADTITEMKGLARKAQSVASRLPVEGRIDLLAAVLRLTFPNGIAPCVEKLTALGAAIGDDVALPSAPASKSPKSSSNSSSAGTTKTASGDAPRAN